MPRVDGLVALVDGCAAFLAAQGCTATVDLGWSKRSQQLNQGAGGANRVLFIPGRIDPSSGEPKVVDAGALKKPRMVGDNPRALAEWDRAVSLSVWAVDSTDPSSERLQYAATVDLFELAIQGIHRAVFVQPDGSVVPVGLADVVLESLQWVLPPVEMGFGRELFAYFTLRGPIFDVTLDTATPQPAIARGSLT